MSILDWKSKYMDIRAKLLESTNVAFRLGYEAGMKEARQQDTQMQMSQMATMGGQPMGGQPMEEQSQQEEIPNEQGSNLDSHIEELQSLVAKGQKPSVLNMRKAVNDLIDLRKTQKAKMQKQNQAVVSSQKKFIDNILKKWQDETKDIATNLEDIIKEQE